MELWFFFFNLTFKINFNIIACSLFDTKPILLIVIFINAILHMVAFAIDDFLAGILIDIKLVVDNILICQYTDLRLSCVYIQLHALPLISIYWLDCLPVHYSIDLSAYLASCTLVSESIYSKGRVFFKSFKHTAGRLSRW